MEPINVNVNVNVNVNDISMCLMHEHIIIAAWDMLQNYDDYVDVEKEVPKAVGSLNKAKERGVSVSVATALSAWTTWTRGLLAHQRARTDRCHPAGERLRRADGSPPRCL